MGNQLAAFGFAGGALAVVAWVVVALAVARLVRAAALEAAAGTRRVRGGAVAFGVRVHEALASRPGLLRPVAA